MANTTSMANLGDIIRSEKFAYGKYGYVWKNQNEEFVLSRNVIDVDGRTIVYPVKQRKPSTLRTPEYITVDEGAYDPSRGQALFVVEEAKMAGGGNAMFNDHYDDGWYVQARRLDDKGEYDPEGELIRFYQSGCFTNKAEEVELVGNMRRVFVR